jgi:hypothetical protein
MEAQGVTGIRIFVTFCEPFSMAFSNCGSPWQDVSWNPVASPPNAQYDWLQNVKTFFGDVKAAGIQNVTVTLASGGKTYTVPSSQTVSPATPSGGNCSESGACCIDTPSTVLFDPYVPFGMNPANGTRSATGGASPVHSTRATIALLPTARISWAGQTYST